MDNLKTIESIEITSCPRLKNINGFPNLKKIHQRLKISSNDSLLDITAFNKLDSIGSIGISNNQRLQSINGFQNLKHIDWGLTISSNSVLADINNFQSLHTISSNVDISSNDILQNIHAFSKLQTINGNIKITNNKSMEFINSFNKLEFINGDFSIQQCKELIEINGFELLKHIGGSVEISSNFNLQTITALNSIKHIYKSISISSNKVLVNLNGLHNIDSIDGNLIIKNLLDIQNLEGLEKLKHVGGTFLIENGIELRSFNGLGNITEANALIIKNNNNLQDISALRSLRLIKSKLSIINNKTIENLHGLENLSIINGSLGITGNNTLNSIDGIKNAIINGRLFIYQNKDLAICDCESICDFINSHQSYEYMIHSNATGCDSPEEISEACQINGFYNPDVFPLIDVNPNWNLLQSTYSIPNRTVTKSFSYTNNYTVCYKQYSKINFPDINQRAYIRSNHEKTYYRRNEDCLKKEYLLYDYTLEVGDTAWLGWNQYEWMSKDTAAFVLESIDTVKQFGVNHRRFHMVYAEEDQAFNGSLKWIEGIGSEIHPFYPFGLLSESLMTEYNLLCYDSSSVQLYQNPLFNTCDSNYIAIEEIEKNGLIIAPNPFQNQTTIKSPQEKILQVKVYSITGKLMQDFSPDDQHSVILTFDQDTPQGIYLLQVITGSKMIQRKILRQ